MALAIGGLFPNPAIDIMNVIINAPARDNVKLTIMDITGKILRQQTMNVETGSNVITINVNNLPKGTYAVKVTSEANRESARSNFVK
jgi:hypothetical protein